MTSTLPNLQQALSQLIAMPSISSDRLDFDQSNLPVIELLASWFESLGFTISIDQVINTNNKYNMLATLGSGEGGLLLSGHSDTVPYDDQGWLTDPFKLRLIDDKFYGLGSCDMKGFFAFVLQACTAIPRHKLTKPLYILVTADEETTMAGARFFVKQQLVKPEVAIIGEPTELKPVHMHKGHMSHRITVRGKSGHSSDPANGLNAIEVMVEVIQRLQLLRKHLQQNYRNAAFSVQQPTLNLGAIKGGDNANRICQDCYLDIDLRAIPGIADEDLLAWLADALLPICKQHPGSIQMQPLHASSPAFKEAQDSELVVSAQRFSGHCCQAVNYATEAPFIQQLGCQTLVLGPGSIDQAHQANEYLHVDQVEPTLALLHRLITHYCCA
ncbi:acetylornithine deacetylase [Thalassotalea ponticola]|uniref:acetylornithine deacetylase n=1 Tax=Thalassotalea ponticola TaxID=1523392 RepID=UPI0025B39C4B|nr:acetylornithine deacetylase [Thalassotalea ponticola]MDN3652862.1 acetylornithine deacetylase [Thalassotalea ponticola]